MQGTEWKKLRNLSTEELNALTEEQLKKIIVEEYKACEATNLFKFGTSEEKSETLWYLARYFDGCDKSILEALLEDFLKKPEGRDLFEKLFSLDAAKLKPRISESRTYDTIVRDNKQIIDEVEKCQDQLYKIRYFLAQYEDTITYINLLNDKIRANKAKNPKNQTSASPKVPDESGKQDPEIQISEPQDTTVRVASKKNNSLNAVIARTQKARLKTFEELSKVIATKLKSFDGDERADFEKRFQEIKSDIESNVEITGKILDAIILKLEELNQEISSAQGVITDNKYYSEDEILDSFEQRIREKFSNFAPQDVHILQEPKAWIVLQTIADFQHRQKINIDMLLDEVEDEKERDALEAMIFSLNPEALYERGDLTYTTIVKKHAEQIKLVQNHNDLFNKIYFFLKDPEVLKIIEQAKAYATEYGVPNDNAIMQPTSSSIPSSSQSGATITDIAMDEILSLLTNELNSKKPKNGSKNQPESVIIGENVGNDLKVSSTTRPNMSEARMRTAAEIFREAKQADRQVQTSKRPVTAFLDKDTYNTEFLLDGRQIHAQALIRLSQKLRISLNAAAEYYIYDINLERGIESRLADTGNFNEETGKIETNINQITGIEETNFQSFYGEPVQKAVEAAKQGKPAFLAIIDGSHSVLLSLIQDKNDANKVQVIYTNSIPAGQTGFRFVEHLKNKLREVGVLSGDNATFASIDQQLDQCCGLSVAENIASIAKHCEDGGATDADSIKRSLKSFPRGNADKQPFYESAGRELFKALDNQNINFDAQYSPPAPQGPAGAQNANQNGGRGASANSQQAPEHHAKPQAKKQTQNDPEGKSKEANNPEAKKGKKKDEKNEVVSPKNHDKEKESVSNSSIMWFTVLMVGIGAFAPHLATAVAFAALQGLVIIATKLIVGVLDAVKNLIEAIASLIKGILDSVRALLKLFGKGIDYVVTKVTGKEKLINDVPLEDLPRREQNQHVPQNPIQPDGPANQSPNLARLTVPAAETQQQPQAANTAPVPPAANTAPVPPAANTAPVPPAAAPAPVPPAANTAPVPPAAAPAPVPPAANTAPVPPAAAPAPVPPAAAPAPVPATTPANAVQDNGRPIYPVGTEIHQLTQFGVRKAIIAGEPPAKTNVESPAPQQPAVPATVAGTQPAATQAPAPAAGTPPATAPASGKAASGTQAPATSSQGEQSKSQNNSNPADKTHASRARSNSNPYEKTNPLDSEKRTIQRRNSNPTLPTREK